MAKNLFTLFFLATISLLNLQAHPIGDEVFFSPTEGVYKIGTISERFDDGSILVEQVTYPFPGLPMTSEYAVQESKFSKKVNCWKKYCVGETIKENDPLERTIVGDISKVFANGWARVRIRNPHTIFHYSSENWTHLSNWSIKVSD